MPTRAAPCAAPTSRSTRPSSRNPPRRPLDYSACKYGHMSVNDPSPAGEGCMRKPAGKCEVCTRESGAGNTRNHTCACLTEAQRTKVYDKIKDARLQLGGVLLGMGALWLAHSVWVMTDDDRLDRYSFGDRDGCSPGTFSTVNWRAVHLPAPHARRRRGRRRRRIQPGRHELLQRLLHGIRDVRPVTTRTRENGGYHHR